VQTALGKVLRGFGVVPFKLPDHPLKPHTTYSGAAYHGHKSRSNLNNRTVNLRISGILCLYAMQPLNVAHQGVLPDLKAGHSTGTEAVHA
jgi:hypothetical protein